MFWQRANLEELCLLFHTIECRQDFSFRLSNPERVVSQRRINSRSFASFSTTPTRYRTSLSVFRISSQGRISAKNNFGGTLLPVQCRQMVPGLLLPWSWSRSRHWLAFEQRTDLEEPYPLAEFLRTCQDFASFSSPIPEPGPQISSQEISREDLEGLCLLFNTIRWGQDFSFLRPGSDAGLHLSKEKIWRSFASSQYSSANCRTWLPSFCNFGAGPRLATENQRGLCVPFFCDCPRQDFASCSTSTSTAGPQANSQDPIQDLARRALDILREIFLVASRRIVSFSLSDDTTQL